MVYNRAGNNTKLKKIILSQKNNTKLRNKNIGYKTPRGEKKPRYKVPQKILSSDETTVPYKRLISFKCQYRFLTSVVFS